MARTHGHGNPKWTRDETMLALDLYFECGGNMPSGKDGRVQKLSKLLRSLPYHGAVLRKDSFRNPDGAKEKGSGVIVDRLVLARLLFFARPSLLVC
jgi:5-methylcytosine-specific restriction protein A